jgi:hypothetical protein
MNTIRTVNRLKHIIKNQHFYNGSPTHGRRLHASSRFCGILAMTFLPLARASESVDVKGAQACTHRVEGGSFISDLLGRLYRADFFCLFEYL